MTEFGTSSHWPNRAEEHRVQAAQMTNPIAKQQMLQLAETYERWAERAEDRSKIGAVQNPDEKSL